MKITINKLKRVIYYKDISNCAFVRSFPTSKKKEVLRLLNKFHKVFDEEIENQLHIRDYDALEEIKKYNKIIDELNKFDKNKKVW